MPVVSKRCAGVKQTQQASASRQYRDDKFIMLRVATVSGRRFAGRDGAGRNHGDGLRFYYPRSRAFLAGAIYGNGVLRGLSFRYGSGLASMYANKLLEHNLHFMFYTQIAFIVWFRVSSRRIDDHLTVKKCWN